MGAQVFHRGVRSRRENLCQFQLASSRDRVSPDLNLAEIFVHDQVLSESVSLFASQSVGVVLQLDSLFDIVIARSCVLATRFVVHVVIVAELLARDSVHDTDYSVSGSTAVGCLATGRFNNSHLTIETDLGRDLQDVITRELMEVVWKFEIIVPFRQMGQVPASVVEVLRRQSSSEWTN